MPDLFVAKVKTPAKVAVEKKVKEDKEIDKEKLVIFYKYVNVAISTCSCGLCPPSPFSNIATYLLGMSFWQFETQKAVFMFAKLCKMFTNLATKLKLGGFLSWKMKK